MNITRKVSFTLLPTVHLYRKPEPYINTVQYQQEKNQQQDSQQQDSQQQDSQQQDSQQQDSQQQDSQQQDLTLIPPLNLLNIKKETIVESISEISSTAYDLSPLSPRILIEISNYRIQESLERKNALEQALQDFECIETQISPISLRCISPIFLSTLTLSPKII
jgi:hypothetical protein